MNFFADLQSMNCSPESMIATVRHDVEIDPKIDLNSRYPAALNTPLDQIPLTLADLQRLAAEIDAAIKEVTNYGEHS